jgi:hypothetical protein
MTTVPVPVSHLTPCARLTAAQFDPLAEIPPELEWFANLTTANPRRAYRQDITDFQAFASLRWAADTLPGFFLEHGRDKFLWYTRAHGLTHLDRSEALKFWWLEAHARAVRRIELQLPAAPRSTPAPELPPAYDVELHAQMQADITRFCGLTDPSILGTNDNKEPRRRRIQTILTAEGMAPERNPAYLAQIRARKAMLKAQVVLLQAQALCVEATGAAD